MNTYVFDQGWQKERDRLSGIESLYDSYSTQRLADLGVSEGWHCLEVGFGAGGIALWLAGQVGSTGRVVAVDLDPRFLDGHGRANLDVRKHDILTHPLEEAAFDLAHARAVLEHIPDRQRALERMISAVRPGGWLVLEAIDFGGVMAAAMAHYVDPPEHAPLYERTIRAIEAAFAAAGGDASARHDHTRCHRSEQRGQGFGRGDQAPGRVGYVRDDRRSAASELHRLARSR